MKDCQFQQIEPDPDMKVLMLITQGDIMEQITINGDGTEKLLEEKKARIDEWNKILGY